MMVMATIQRVTESRRSPRQPVRLSTAVATHPAGSLAIVVRDLSTTGLLFESQAPFSIGEQLRIVLPQDVVATAKVVWSDARGYGGEFEAPLSRGALSAALLKGEPYSRSNGQYSATESVERWPRPTRVALIVGGSALLWTLIALAIAALR